MTVVKTSSCCVASKYLEMDLKFPEDAARQYADIVVKHVTIAADVFRRLFFVDNMVKTLKVCVLYTSFTYHNQ